MDMNYGGGNVGGKGVGRMEWSVGGKWDNCNSIINKYIQKKRCRWLKKLEVSRTLNKDKISQKKKRV